MDVTPLDSPASPVGDNALMRAATAAAARVWPGAPVFPRMSTGTTESSALRRAGIAAYGIDPFALTPEDARTAHAPNERIPVASLQPGADFVHQLLAELEVSPPAMTTPKSPRAPQYLALPASALPSCASRTSPPSSSAGPVARLWRASAQGHDFEHFTRQGTALTPEGVLVLDPASSAPADPFASHTLPGPQAPLAAGSYVLGRALSEEHLIPGGFDNVVPSFDVLTPPGTWVRLTLAARVRGQWTKDYDFGVWTLEPGPVTRHSSQSQEDEHGKVLTDTLVLKHPADALRMTVWLFSSRPDTSPRVRALAAATTDTGRPPAHEPTDPGAWGTVLEVPGRSQLLYPPDGGRWCSPTSVSMLLAYWGQRLGHDTLSVPVPGVAEHSYDATYGGTGNWPFNTAYASALADGALHGLVARFDSFTQVERLIAGRIPVSISISFEKGELTGAPMERTDGHLIVVKGFTPRGDVVCNDPAFPSDTAVEVTYRRGELLRAWEHSLRSAYVLWPAGTALPPGAVSWVS